jgi:tRNA modification GTPase
VKVEAARDTIFALSSGAPPAAIAIIRISGPAADATLAKLTATLPPARVARLTPLRHRGELLDNALVLRFPGPASATGEDLVEFHLHGGRAVVAGVLSALDDMQGLRPARPGEFTRRAFENGRIDLSEAEGLADLLSAETRSQRRSAQALAGGALSRQTEAWQRSLLSLSAMLEAVLDFSDEGEVGEALPELWHSGVSSLVAELEATLARPPAERLRDGVRVVIAGPPNAGKSSLLNHLAGRDAAITSPIAGTTRDLVEAPTAIGGVPMLLVDTAGLRQSLDEVEAIGVARAEDSVAGADLVLWLGCPLEAPERARAIVVQSKIDLGGERDPHADIAVSARSGEGLDELTDLLVTRARALLPAEGEVAVNGRHRRVLSESLTYLHEARGANDLIIAAEALRLARMALDQVTGRAGVEDMLGVLFQRFCIGK